MTALAQDPVLAAQGRPAMVVLLTVVFVNLVGFGVLLPILPFYGRMNDDGQGWWLWTCLAGCGLGLLGLEYCRRRRKARAEHRTLPLEQL